MKNSITRVLAILAVLMSIPLCADTQAVTALVEALRLAAPKTDDPSLYTDWKMKEGAIASWTRRCVGVPVSGAELAEDPIMARNTVTCVMGRVLAEQWTLTGGDEALAVRRAAAWWMTGDAMQYQSDQIGAYLDRVMSEYRSLRDAR